MATKIFLTHKDNNKIKVGVVGFSWTTFFFGIFVPLFRKDMKIFLPFLCTYLVVLYFMLYSYSNIDGAISLQVVDELGIYNKLSSLYYLIVNILGAFCYNRIYTQALINKGFYPVSSEGAVILKLHNINLPNHMFEDTIE